LNTPKLSDGRFLIEEHLALGASASIQQAPPLAIQNEGTKEILIQPQ